MNNFNHIFDKIQQIKDSNRYKTFVEYNIPGHWIGDAETGIIETNAIGYFSDRLMEINRLSKEVSNAPSHDNSVVYGMFIRYSCAFDHDQDCEVNQYPLSNGLRETGTILKAIALLPYLKSLGINIIYLLPVTKIGIDGKKGDLGSPYAVKNPLELDEKLSEPFLNISIEDQFKAFIEAAHSLNIKVVMESVLRTASIDSDWAKEHPDWFYWIKQGTKLKSKDSFDENSFGPPLFNDMELSFIKQKVSSNDLSNLTHPNKNYRALFTESPSKVDIFDNKLIGNSNNGEVKIAGAFADWPPDDNQPPWSDVTYLKLYDHSDFNYIAYNTVRMYDRKLSITDNQINELWESIVNIIPHYIREYDIDGAMIDMGHALPNELRKRIINSSRELKPNFIFWEENFEIKSESKEQGYDATLGYLCFIQHDVYQMKDFLNMLADRGAETCYFATPDTHNTPRAASKYKNLQFSKVIYLMNGLLTGITFINSGFELYESMPINTGLGFVDEELEQYSDLLLPLFSSVSMHWENTKTLIIFIQNVNLIKRKYIDNSNNQIINIPVKGNCLCFLRETTIKNQYLIIIASYDIENFESRTIKLPFMIDTCEELIGNISFRTKKASIMINVSDYSYFCGLITVGEH